jgi:formamidopyrimidine-DNA glycosylase
MPELPEVETIARGVDQSLRGDRILDTWFSDKREPFKSSPQAMAEMLPGRRIERVFRVGKHIVFDLELENGSARGAKSNPRADGAGKSRGAQNLNALQWIVHLGMTGRLLVSNPAAPVPPHTHCILSLASGRQLRFVDPRRFGRLSLFFPSSEDRGFAGSGREPLTISADEFAALFRGRRTSIKAALLNKKLLQGVGNIYADESLFCAGIRPRRMAARLKGAELERLRAGLRTVLRQAISLGGSSVSDYVNADGARGFFQLEHRVYLRTGQPCLVCGTLIRKITVAGRSTHYCPTCQK